MRELAPRSADRTMILDALYWHGDSGAAREAVTRVARHADRALATQADERRSQYRDICTIVQWRLWHHEFRGIELAGSRFSPLTFTKRRA